VELQNDADDQDLVDISYDTEDAVLDHSDMQQPTSHTRRKLKAAENWEILQNSVLDIAFSAMGEPRFTCTSCKEALGMVKCHHCGPQTYYCENCAVSIHQYSLFHHYMEIWQVCVFYAVSVLIVTYHTDRIFSATCPTQWYYGCSL